ncbi:MAG TPA: ribonuclease M5 [Negativicutes bacterium]|nr:ribonuclease M5 [Negativicutes bacterium]
MIREVIVVEGKQDVAAVKRAVDADCLTTEGFSLSSRSLAQIEAAYIRRGIIILTDPDSAGERIRKVLAERFPAAKHAFVPREAATADGDVGIEQASAVAIRAALTKTRCQEWQPEPVFAPEDMRATGLVASPAAAARRAALGGALGIGYANAKTFLRRLNNYGVTRAEFSAAVAAMEADDD